MTELRPSRGYIDRRYARPSFSGSILCSSKQIHSLACGSIRGDQFFRVSAAVISQYSEGFRGHAAENLLPPILLVLDVSGEIHSASDNSSLPIESQFHKGVPQQTFSQKL